MQNKPGYTPPFVTPKPAQERSALDIIVIILSLVVGIGAIYLLSNLAYGMYGDNTLAAPIPTANNQIIIYPTTAPTKTLSPAQASDVTNTPGPAPSRTPVPPPTRRPTKEITLEPTATRFIMPTPKTYPGSALRNRNLDWSTCSCKADIYNCSDFATQNDAQACGYHCWLLTGKDIHKLDGDHDGRACE